MEFGSLGEWAGVIVALPALVVSFYSIRQSKETSEDVEKQKAVIEEQLNTFKAWRESFDSEKAAQIAAWWAVRGDNEWGVAIRNERALVRDLVIEQHGSYAGDLTANELPPGLFFAPSKGDTWKISSVKEEDISPVSKSRKHSIQRVSYTDVLGKKCTYLMREK
ncbi:MAG: hypothetical protein PUK40_05910 [Actinomycetaceae bacterium]|nr:hypothetical protein [Arcanobacterium sp.]MDD7505465.1 hypothetical protein [Actinomycetaceae bacterium]MDY6143151.1 hypothetical protein [Arcanobacterium sp.]